MQPASSPVGDDEPPAVAGEKRRRSSAAAASSGGRRRSSLLSFGTGGGSGGRRRSSLFSFLTRGSSTQNVSEDSHTTPITLFRQYWSGLAWTGDDQQEDESVEVVGDRSTAARTIRTSCASRCSYFVDVVKLAMTSRKIVAYTVLTFLILSTAGLAIVLVFADRYAASREAYAMEKALEMGFRIPQELQRALLPLFTMQEIIRRLDTFNDLPQKMNQTDKYLTGDPPGRAWRNATKLCLDPAYVDPFNAIARSVKDSARMPGVLVNVQLAPFGAVCLLFPLVNMEDFDDGIVMNNTGAIGLDILNDPVSGYYTREAIKNSRVTIQGPLTLVQGGVPVVKEALIARNPIYVDGFELDIDDQTYPFWGFTTVLLNWAQLKEKVELDSYFASRNLEYQMTRTDTLVNFTSMEEYKQTVTIAQSNRSSFLGEANSVTVPIKNTDNEWALTVGYAAGYEAPWRVWACIVVVLGALLASFGVLLTLVEKKKHELLLYRMMPRDIVHRLQRGDTIVEKYDLATICIFDIVSFTSLSGNMAPKQVLLMLKELYSEFDIIARRHQVINGKHWERSPACCSCCFVPPQNSLAIL